MSMTTVPQVHPSHKSTPLLDLLDRPIAFHRIFVTLTGSVAAGLMLSQAYYWSRRTRDPGGWFYKTQVEWHEETGLSRSEQETARKALRKTTFWREARRGLPAKLYFRLDLEELERLLLRQPAPPPLKRKNPQQNHQSAGFQHSSLLSPSTLECRDPADQCADIPPTITEITAEITPETFPEIDFNVDNVETDHQQTKRWLRLSPRQHALVEELERQLDDTHSRGAFCRIVSDHGLGEEVAYRLLRETLEHKRHVKGPLGAYFIDLCKREAQRQEIDLGFKRHQTLPPGDGLPICDRPNAQHEPDDWRPRDDAERATLWFIKAPRFTRTPGTLITLGAVLRRDPEPTSAPPLRPLGSGAPQLTMRGHLRALLTEEDQPTLRAAQAKRQAREAREAPPMAAD